MGVAKSQTNPEAVRTDFVTLVSMMDAGTLIPGTIYELFDWQTHYKAWDGSTHYNQPADYTLVDPGGCETLYLVAANTYSVSADCTSASFPEDEIRISIASSSDMWKSQITYRRDTRKNVSAHYDWRFVKFPRFAIRCDVTVDTDTHTAVDEISPSHTGQLSGWSHSAADYAGLNSSDVTGCYVTNPHTINTPSSATELTHARTTTVSTSKYEHRLTFVDNYATGFANVSVEPDSLGESVLHGLSDWTGGGNNIVMHVASTDCSISGTNGTTGGAVTSTNMRLSRACTYLNTDRCDIELENFLAPPTYAGPFSLPGTAAMSRCVGLYSSTVICRFVDATDCSVQKVSGCTFAPTGTPSTPPSSNSTFSGNTGSMLSESAFTKGAGQSYSVSDNEFVNASRIRTKADSFAGNTLVNCSRISVNDAFERNKVENLSRATFESTFSDCSMTSEQLDTINFGTAPILGKHKNHETSTFSTTVDLTDGNRLDGNLRLLLYDDEIQYIGQVLLTLPGSYVLPTDIEVYSMSAPSPIPQTQHRIRLRPQGMVNLFVWNTPPTLTALVSATRNISIEDPRVIGLAGRNHDWLELQAEKIGTVSCWFQYIAGRYDLDGEIDLFQYGGPVGPGSGTNCCDRLDAIEAEMRYRPLAITSISATGLSGSNPAHYDASNTSADREHGERITSLFLSFTLSKPDELISSVRVDWVPDTGASSTLATLPNLSTQTLVAISTGSGYISGSGYLKLIASSSQVPPTGGSDTTEATVRVEFGKVIYWSMSALAGPLSQSQVKSMNKLRTQTPYVTISYPPPLTDSYLYMCIPTSLLTSPSIVPSITTLTIGTADSPIISHNGIVQNWWANHTASVTTYSATTPYTVLRSVYTNYAGTRHKITIERP